MESYILSRLADTPSLAKSYTIKDGKPLMKRFIFYRLKKYVDSFLEGDESNRFIILYGLRGVGKTTLLFQVYNYLLEQKKIGQDNLFYLSVDNLQAMLGENIANTVESYAELVHKTSIINISEKTFIFIDEAHFDTSWSLAVKSIYDSSKNIFIIATGSSAIALNISTDTARRATREPVYPLRFLEYTLLKNKVLTPKNTSQTIQDLILSGTPAAVKKVRLLEEDIGDKFSKKNIDVDNELRDFMEYRGFTFGLDSSRVDMHRKINDLVSRIVSTDLPLAYSYDSETQSHIYRIIGNLALKAPGETSHSKLASTLGISPTTVNRILEALEKTHLIFTVKPLPKGSARAWTGKPWKYYFLTPTILSVLSASLGADTDKDQTQGLLWETAVASGLHRITETSSAPLELFYDDNKTGNADFLIKNKLDGTIIPIEAGTNKTKKQVIDAIERYRSKHGILLTNLKNTEKTGKTIKVPLKTFMYM